MKNIVSALVGTTALTAGLVFAAPSMEAQAATLGSIDIVGDAEFTPTAINFDDAFVLSGDGVFDGLVGASASVASLSRPSLTPLSSPLVSGGLLSPLVSGGLPSFSFKAIPSSPSFALDTGNFVVGEYAGKWTVDSKTYQGSIILTAQQIGDASSFSISGTAVPEPLTMLGAGLAVALGAGFKKQASKSKG